MPALRAAFDPGSETASRRLADRVLFVHSQRVDIPIKWRQSSVMTKRWRLVNGVELYDIATDPAQTTDLAARNAEVVAELRRSYDAWWKSLEPVFDDTVRIVIGSQAESPTALTSHDWRTPDEAQVVWNAGQVNSLHAGNGYWALDVVRGGRYEIELRRWPRPSRLGIDATRARLEIGGLEREMSTSPYDAGATFQVELAAGPTTLETWLTASSGKTRGAYFVYVRRVE